MRRVAVAVVLLSVLCPGCCCSRGPTPRAPSTTVPRHYLALLVTQVDTERDGRPVYMIYPKTTITTRKLDLSALGLVRHAAATWKGVPWRHEIEAAVHEDDLYIDFPIGGAVEGRKAVLTTGGDGRTYWKGSTHGVRLPGETFTLRLTVQSAGDVLLLDIVYEHHKSGRLERRIERRGLRLAKTELVVLGG